MARQTPLHDLHVALGARLVDFGGWDMPVHYGSQIDEHRSVRRGAGLFDVSHMCVIDLHGAGAQAFLQTLLANDVGRLKIPGKALYSCMLNAQGGVIDDLIVYLRGEDTYRLVVNAGTRDQDLGWIRSQAQQARLALQIVERTDLAMIAIQGPEARECLASQLPAMDREATLQLQPFFARELESNGWYVARTGYTGEDGFEVMLPAAQVAPLWRALGAAGAVACGLGARDTLRLEAGMNLYGNDMDATHHPLESVLGWTVAFEPPTRDFIGRAALEALRAAGTSASFLGLLLEDRGVLRGHQRVVLAGGAEGEVTSGTFSPTLERSIGFARLPRGTTPGTAVQVDIRGRLLHARVVKLPFIRNGRVLIELNPVS